MEQSKCTNWQFINIYLKNYYNAGFSFIIDFFDNNGNFLSLDGVKELKVKTNFVEYAGLKNAFFPIYLIKTWEIIMSQ